MTTTTTATMTMTMTMTMIMTTTMTTTTTMMMMMMMAIASVYLGSLRGSFVKVLESAHVFEVIWGSVSVVSGLSGARENTP